MIHFPILRQGVPYKSLDVVTVPHEGNLFEHLYARRSFQQHADEALAAAADA